MNALSNVPIIDVPITDVVIGERRREKLGALQSLKRSIQAHGLLHPIILRNGLRLVAGRRRLEACTQLGWRTIPARRVEDLDDEQLRAIELEENTARESLSTYETSKARLAVIRQSEAESRAAAKAEKEAEPKDGGDYGHNVDENAPKTRKHRHKAGAKRGRPKEPGSKRDTAARTGQHPETQARTERHVELAERFPFMQRAGWVQHSVLEAGTHLANLTDTDQRNSAALLDQDAIPPRTAIAILKNLTEVSAERRKTIFRLAKSDDEMDRRTALTMAAALPPPPDPGLTLLGDASRILKRASVECRDSEFKDRISAQSTQTEQLHTEFHQHWREKVSNA